MIDIQIEGKKFKEWTPVVVSSPVKVVDSVVGDIMAESARREELVKKLYRECPYRPGDTVIPKYISDRKKYGEKIIVMSIVDSYAKFGKDETWPSNDTPYLVTAKSYDKDTIFLCTTDFLIPVKKKESA